MTAEPGFRWTQDEWGDDLSPAGPSALRRIVERHGWLVRGAILLLALILFKLTANAAVATAVSCLELGRTDLGTALWLRRVDPDRRRGRLMALCYLAGGCCRVGIVAMAAASFLPVLALCLDPPGARGGPPQHFVGALVMMVAAFLVSAAVSLWVSGAAFVSGRKLWFGPEPRLARRQGVWPPSLAVWPTSRRPNNEAEALLLMASLLVLVPGIALLVWLGIQIPAAMITIPLFALGFIVGVLIVRDRVVARSPGECWPIEEESASTGVAASL